MNWLIAFLGAFVIGLGVGTLFGRKGWNVWIGIALAGILAAIWAQIIMRSF